MRVGVDSSQIDESNIFVNSLLYTAVPTVTVEPLHVKLLSKVFRRSDVENVKKAQSPRRGDRSSGRGKGPDRKVPPT